jgi:hypothetical protein
MSAAGVGGSKCPSSPWRDTSVQRLFCAVGSRKQVPRKAKAGWRAGDSQNADTSGDSGANPNRSMRLWRDMARVAMTFAGWALDRYALATDDPEPGMVEGADLLDAARDAMAGTP